jgi:hypothetical protein
LSGFKRKGRHFELMSDIKMKKCELYFYVL